MVDNVIILAGGSGTRLWPASVRKNPKQFMDPGNGMSLLTATIRRAEATGAPGEIVIVTHKDHVAGAVRECATLGDLASRITIIPEPEGKNTAAAVACGVAYLTSRERLQEKVRMHLEEPASDEPLGASDLTGSDAVRWHEHVASAARSGYSLEQVVHDPADQTLLVLAADHVITPASAFSDDTERADFLAREGFLVTFGITPTRAETGYGYIEAGEHHGPGRRVAAFKEKPDYKTAESYAASGHHFWNSGMFVFRSDRFMEELTTYVPTVAGPFTAVAADPARAREIFASTVQSGVRIAGNPGALASLYGPLPKTSVDFAVMEQTPRAAVVEATFNWNDVGSWDEMAKLHETGVLHDATAPGAAPAGTEGPPVVQVNSRNNYVHADLPVALCGVENLTVIVKNGKVLVCRRGESQHVKDVVEEIKTRELNDLL